MFREDAPLIYFGILKITQSSLVYVLLEEFIVFFLKLLDHYGHLIIFIKTSYFHSY